jgi:DNA invertase Pin-like site-specific DNA recombinase
VFADHGESSRVVERPQWLACLDYLRAGDTLVVRRLDRIAGSETMAIQAISELQDRGVNIKSLTEPDIDTTTPMGLALFGIVAVFAQLRVDTIRDNTRRGLEHARSQGRVGGRPSVMTPERVEAARRMRAEEPPRSIQHIARVLGVGKSSVARALSATAENNEEAIMPTEDRVFFRDTKPYDVPASLNDLQGPAGGRLELPHRLYWGPERTVDLDTEGGAVKAYQAVIREGSAEDQAQFLNRGRLVELWPSLMLPTRVRDEWERQIPELRATVSA